MKSKKKIGFLKIASRITGIQIPIFGVSWNPPELERDIVRETFIFLEDRRVLYIDYSYEYDQEVAQSVIEIRSELTAALKRLPETSEAGPLLKSMRASCREYLNSTRRRNRGFDPRLSFMAQLGKLRAFIGVQVAYLAVKYGIDVDGDLVKVIPPELRDLKYLKA